MSSISPKYGGSEYTTHYGVVKAGLDAVTHTFVKEGGSIP